MQLIDTVGIEIEVARIPKKRLREILQTVRRKGWALVEDGSCRSRSRMLGYLPITEFQPPQVEPMPVDLSVAAGTWEASSSDQVRESIPIDEPQLANSPPITSDGTGEQLPPNPFRSEPTTEQVSTLRNTVGQLFRPGINSRQRRSRTEQAVAMWGMDNGNISESSLIRTAQWLLGETERELLGGEFVSPLLDTSNDKWLSEVSYLLHALYKEGEGVDPHTSIHVHVNMSGMPLFALKYLSRIGLYLEAGMYRLACAESGIHRGALHLDYGYCRPISEKGPPITHTVEGPLRPVFDIKKLLNARDKDEVATSLGRYDLRGGNKYHEARYVWLNFCSLFMLGSIEFRLFNFTTNVRAVETWVNLCKKIAQASFGKQTELPENPLGTSELQFQDIIEFLGIGNNKVAYGLENLWEQGKYQRAVLGYQLGHLGRSTDWREVSAYLIPSEVDPEEVISFDHQQDNNPLTPGWLLLS